MIKKLSARIGVYEEEIELFVWTVLLLFIVRSGGTILNNYADATFLKRYGVEFMPVVNMINAIATVVIMGFVAGLMQKLSGTKLLIAMFIISGTSMGVIRTMIPFGLDLIYPLLFMLKAQFDVLLALLFWNMANDLFNTQQAKRLFPLVTAGGVVGQILASFGTPWFARTLMLDNLLLAYLVCTIAGAVAVHFMAGRFPLLATRRRTKKKDKANQPSMIDEFRRVWPMVKESALIKFMIILTFVPNVVIPIVNYQFNYAVNNQFATEGGLLEFFGYMRGVLNIISLVLLLFVGKIYGRWGLPVALMFHPFNYALAFLSFLFRFDVFSAVYARMSTQILRTSINVPATAVLTGLFPQSYRAMIRPFLRGTVVRSGLFLGSTLILVSDDIFHPRFLSVLALPLVLIWLSTLFWFKRRYAEILTDLVSGDMSDIKSMPTEDVHNLFRDASVRRKLKEDFTRSQPEESLWYGRLLKTLNDDELDHLVLEKIDSADAENRIQLMELLSTADAQAVTVLRELASGSPPRLQAAAIATLMRITPLALTGDIDFAPLLNATSAQVRAHAAAAMLPADPDRYKRLIRSWIDDSDSDVRSAGIIAAGVSGDPDFFPHLERILMGESDAAVQSAVLNALGHIPTPRLKALAEPYLRHKSPRVRQAAVAAFRITDKEALDMVIPLLGDSAPAVSQQAITQIIDGPFHDGKRLIRALSIPGRKLREEIFKILDVLDIKDVDIMRFVRGQAQGAYKYLIEAQAAASLADCPERRLLAKHLCEQSQLQVENIIRVLATQDATGSLRIVSRGLRSTNPRQKANSEEALGDLLDKSVARIIIPLVDASPIEQKIAHGRKLFKLNGFLRRGAKLIEHLLTHEHWVTRVLALETAFKCAVPGVEPRMLAAAAMDNENRQVQIAAERLLKSSNDGSPQKEISMDSAMSVSDKILLLNRIKILSGLSTGELSAIASVTEEIDYRPGVHVMTQENEGNSLYLIIKGKVAVIKRLEDDTEIELDHMTSGDYFGEMALFDDSERSASIVTAEKTRLLFLHKQDFDEIVHQYPQIALAICRALTQRIRRLNRKVEAYEERAHDDSHD